MSDFNRIYKSILTEGRIPSIFKKATPEEVAERAVQYEKIQMDEWMNDFLKRTDIRKNKDGSWDVDGDVVFLGMKAMTRFPVSFGKITDGSFDCGYCTSLTTLEGAPTTIDDGSFYCNGCISLTTLEYAPKMVGRHFYCWGCGKTFTVEEVRRHCNVKGEIYV